MVFHHTGSNDPLLFECLSFGGFFLPPHFPSKWRPLSILLFSDEDRRHKKSGYSETIIYSIIYHINIFYRGVFLFSPASSPPTFICNLQFTLLTLCLIYQYFYIKILIYQNSFTFHERKWVVHKIWLSVYHNIINNTNNHTVQYLGTYIEFKDVIERKCGQLET